MLCPAKPGGAERAATEAPAPAALQGPHIQLCLTPAEETFWYLIHGRIG